MRQHDAVTNITWIEQIKAAIAVSAGERSDATRRRRLGFHGGGGSRSGLAVEHGVISGRVYERNSLDFI